ncbi:type VII secretion protein EccB [Streptomyces mirabilis]
MTSSGTLPEIDGTAACRITVVGPEHRVDLGVPVTITVDELLPVPASRLGVSDDLGGGDVLQRLDEEPPEPDGTPESLGLSHGSTVHTAVTLERTPAADVSRADLPVDSGLLLQALPLPPQGVTPQVYLVTELGVKYPLAGGNALQALGFADNQVRPIPKAVLDLLPSGPPLSRAGALAAIPAFLAMFPSPTAAASKGR